MYIAQYYSCSGDVLQALRRLCKPHINNSPLLTWLWPSELYSRTWSSHRGALLGPTGVFIMGLVYGGQLCFQVNRFGGSYLVCKEESFCSKQQELHGSPELLLMLEWYHLSVDWGIVKEADFTVLRSKIICYGVRQPALQYLYELKKIWEQFQWDPTLINWCTSTDYKAGWWDFYQSRVAEKQVPDLLLKRKRLEKFPWLLG